jgi:hypothetical protein
LEFESTWKIFERGRAVCPMFMACEPKLPAFVLNGGAQARG